MKNNIQGVGVALVTPFKDSGEVDYDSLSSLVDFVISGGVNYLVALGTTAETPTLSKEEKAGILDCIRQAAGGRVPLIAGVGGNSTREVIASFTSTNLSGYDAVLSVTPYYNKPNQKGLMAHYKAIADASPLPLILYNVPSRTGVNMEAETTLEIAHSAKNVMGIKEACPSLPQMSKILKERPEGFKLISGDDCMAVPVVAIGGDGVISVAANAFPESFCRMIKHAFDGNIRGTSDELSRLSEMFELLFREGNPAGVKAALSIKGLLKHVLRLPLLPVSDKLFDEIREIIYKEKI